MESKKELLVIILNDINESKRSDHWIYQPEKIEVFGDVVDMAIDEGFIKCTKPVRGGQGNRARMVFTEDAKITLAGLNYLEKHNKTA